jgi:salicylate hydroxylase
VDKWKLIHRAPLDTWIHAHSNLVLVGDACHPMLPYLAQGANSSIEDGAVLGLLLSPRHFPSRTQLPETLRIFERMRKARGEGIARETWAQREAFHMPNGPAQVARDTLMLKMLGKPITSPFPSRWTCPDVQAWLYGYDAVKEVEHAMALARAHA